VKVIPGSCVFRDRQTVSYVTEQLIVAALHEVPATRAVQGCE
jgi:hypothetical protein